MSRGPPEIGGLISLKVDNFPFSVTYAERLSSSPDHVLAPPRSLARPSMRTGTPLALRWADPASLRLAAQLW